MSLQTGKGIFLVDGNVLKLDCGDGCTIIDVFKNYWIVYLQPVSCIACKLYFNKAVKKKEVQLECSRSKVPSRSCIYISGNSNTISQTII